MEYGIKASSRRLMPSNWISKKKQNLSKIGKGKFQSLFTFMGFILLLTKLISWSIKMMVQKNTLKQRDCGIPMISSDSNYWRPPYPMTNPPRRLRWFGKVATEIGPNSNNGTNQDGGNLCP